MADLDAAVAQLEDELGDLATRAGAVLGADITQTMIDRAQYRAGWLVTQLADGDLPDEHAIDLLALLWPDGPDLEWWRTPLGLLCAPTATREAGPGWSRAEAARVLGVSPGTVSQLAARGTLEQEDGGRVTRHSVLTRLLRLSGERAKHLTDER